MAPNLIENPRNSVNRIFSQTFSRFNLLGQSFLIDLKELLIIKESPKNIQIAGSLREAKDRIKPLLQQKGKLIGYITGGLEGIHLQTILDGLTADGIASFIIGIEESNYTQSKGRAPLYTTEEKVDLWAQFAPENSLIFVIPTKPKEISANDYYDELARFLGLYGHSHVVYIGSSDDPMEVQAAHLRRAASPKHCLHLSLGNPPIHTSQLLLE